MKVLPNQPSCGKILTVRNGYLLCPYCGHKVKRIDPTESADRVQVFCRARECKREFFIAIKQGRCFESRGHQ